VKGLAPSSPATTGRELERSEMTPIPFINQEQLGMLIKDPAATDRGWARRAACAGLPADAYFPDDGALPTADARAACSSCPVAHECLATALHHEARDGFRHGWWGGVGPTERDEIALQLGIATTPIEIQMRRPVDIARHLRAQNLTIPSIAAELGCTERTVYRYLAAAAA
jgi:hypothetical protein